MKRLLVFLLTLCLLTGLVCTGVSADTPVSGSCGANAKWQFDSDTGTLLISGTGPMEYESNSAPWYDLCVDILHVIVGEGITSVKARAFTHCRMLKTAYIADTVTALGEGAFSNCVRLETVYVGKGISVIEQNTFMSCMELQKVALPAGAQVIRQESLSDSKMTAIIIPDGVITIEIGTLRAANLTSVTIPDSVATVAYSAFRYNTKLQDVYFTGTQAQWNAIVIDEKDGYNDALLDATVHFNHVCTWDSGVAGWEASCYSKHVKTYTCTVCGGTRNESGAMGHVWNEGTVITQPSCTDTGVKKRECTLCGAVENVDIPATEHQWDAGVKNADTTVTYTCTICTEVKTEGTPQALLPTGETVGEPDLPKETQSVPAPTVTPEADPPKPQAKVWPVIVAVAVLAGCGAGGLVWLKKKKQ